MTDARTLATTALSTRWFTERPPATRQDTEEAIRLHSDTLRPLKLLEPGLDGSGGASVLEALKPFGAKIAPHMDDERGVLWATAVAIALSDLPLRFILSAAGKAVHTPMRFLNEVEACIRTAAEAELARHRAALSRLQRYQAELQQATGATPRLPSPPADRPVTDDQIAALSPENRALFVKMGALSQERVDAALGRATEGGRDASHLADTTDGQGMAK